MELISGFQFVIREGERMHTHTHTQREKERERERMNARTIDEGMNAAETLSVSLSFLILARACFFSRGFFDSTFLNY